MQFSVGEADFSPMYVFSAFVKNQIPVTAWVYICIFYSIGLCVCFCASAILVLLLFGYYNAFTIAFFCSGLLWGSFVLPYEF
jgi:hypothetical protein